MCHICQKFKQYAQCVPFVNSACVGVRMGYTLISKMWNNSVKVNEQKETLGDFYRGELRKREDQNEEEMPLKYKIQCVFIITYLII